MQVSQSSTHPLLTAAEVQELLHIDRSTVYRMAEDGRLPAIRVGRSWRFPAERIEAILTDGESAAGQPSRPAPPAAPSGPRGVDTAAARVAVDVAAELLGVMMVVTDMDGRPLTEVANPCPWFAAHGADPEVLATCVEEWRDLAAHPDLTPRFQPGVHGFQCARAFIRSGSSLVGMVLAGGVSPSPDPRSHPDLHHLNPTARERVLTSLPRIAATICTASTGTDATAAATAAAPTRPQDLAATQKEDR